MNSKNHAPPWYLRAISAPEGSFILLGPRGTGKSSWLKRRFPASLRIDLRDPARFRELGARPMRLLDLVREEAGKVETIVVVDAQRLPEVLSVAYLLGVERPDLRLVLAASSARVVRRSGAAPSSGGLVVRELFPLTAPELGPDFALDRALTRGTIPRVLAAADPGEALRDYVDLVVREEVEAGRLARSTGGFYRFLEAAARFHASVINLSSLAREAEVGRKAAEGYLSVLEDLLLAYRVPSFRGGAEREDAGRRIAGHPKLFFVDAGLFAALRAHDPLEPPRIAAGQALAGVVAMHLRACLSYSGAQAALSHWRTATGLEVDFVLSGPAGLTAIALKGPNRPWTSCFRGLAAFADEHPEAKRLLLHRGGNRFASEGVHCLPLGEFLCDVGGYLEAGAGRMEASQEPKE